jgi:hypothetical protein
VYNFSGTANGDTENAAVKFTISNCVTIPSTSCTLDILVANGITSPNDAGQGIIGLSFNIGALMTVPAYDSAISDGSGGPVSEIDLPSGSEVDTVTTSTEWTFVYPANSSGCLNVTAAFCLDGHSLGGQPHDQIIGADATGGNPSEANHSPYLSGPVDFQLTDFAGLTLASTFSNVVMDFGTNPDGTVTGALCTSNCGVGLFDPAPEPGSYLLMGSGLALLSLVRLRRR